MHCCGRDTCRRGKTWIESEDITKATLCAACQKPLHKECGRLWMADTLVCHPCYHRLGQRRRQETRRQEQRRKRKHTTLPGKAKPSSSEGRDLAYAAPTRKRRRSDCSDSSSPQRDETFFPPQQSTKRVTFNLDNDSHVVVGSTVKDPTNERHCTVHQSNGLDFPRAEARVATTRDVGPDDDRPQKKQRVSFWNQLQAMASDVLHTVTGSVTKTAKADSGTYHRKRPPSISTCSIGTTSTNHDHRRRRRRSPLNKVITSPRYMRKKHPDQKSLK